MPGRARVASQHRRELAGCEGRSARLYSACPWGAYKYRPESTGGLARTSPAGGGRAGVAVTVLRVPLSSGPWAAAARGMGPARPETPERAPLACGSSWQCPPGGRSSLVVLLAM